MKLKSGRLSEAHRQCVQVRFAPSEEQAGTGRAGTYGMNDLADLSGAWM